MGTRSTLAILKEDGTVEQVYCHYDGYINVNIDGCVGMILNNHYRDRGKVEELISLGSMSFLSSMIHPPEGAEHSFDKPFPDVTVFYQRDRNEKAVAAEVYKSYEDFMQHRRKQHFNYLYKDSEWFVELNRLRESGCPNRWTQGLEWASLETKIEEMRILDNKEQQFRQFFESKVKSSDHCP